MFFAKLSESLNLKTSFLLVIGQGKRFPFGPLTAPAILSQM